MLHAGAMQKYTSGRGLIGCTWRGLRSLARDVRRLRENTHGGAAWTSTASARKQKCTCGARGLVQMCGERVGAGRTYTAGAVQNCTACAQVARQRKYAAGVGLRKCVRRGLHRIAVCARAARRGLCERVRRGLRGLARKCTAGAGRAGEGTRRGVDEGTRWASIHGGGWANVRGGSGVHLHGMHAGCKEAEVHGGGRGLRERVRQAGYVMGAARHSAMRDAVVAAPATCSAASFAPVVPGSGTAGASDAEW